MTHAEAAIRPRARRRRLHAPAQNVIVGFACAILLGTFLLMLPMSSAKGTWTNPVDALFTATLAVCVTGLTTLDNGTHWSGAGQIVIVSLIQLGGLGIMFFATLIGMVIVRRMTVRSRVAIAAETKALGTDDVARVARGSSRSPSSSS